jgi:hypothetical protein
MTKNKIFNLFLLTSVIGLVISCGGSDNDSSSSSASSSSSSSTPAAASCPTVTNAAGASVVSGKDAAGDLTCTYTGTYNDSFQSDDGTLAADAQGQWGGLQIMGKATQNCTDAEKNASGICERSAEGFDAGAVLYGGNDDNDDSGELSYVVVKYAGYAFTSENELNGIAFYTVGDQTDVSYIRVHNNSDDGIEFFGGTVNFKYAYLTGNQDDSFDYTNGWRGKAQWVIIDQDNPDPATATGNAPDNGMEFDSNSKAPNATPRSNPTISNFLVIAVLTSSVESLLVMHLVQLLGLLRKESQKVPIR